MSFPNDKGKSDPKDVKDTFVKKSKAKHKLSRNEQIPKMRSKEYGDKYSTIQYIFKLISN